MSSNALSIKAFDTKAPVICKAPPWPPTLPVPPVTKTTFYCFATFRYDHHLYPTRFAASCKLHYVAASARWEGASWAEGDVCRISAILWVNSVDHLYTIRVYYSWPTVHTSVCQWSNEPFKTPRPYVGSLISKRVETPLQVWTAVVREVPS